MTTKLSLMAARDLARRVLIAAGTSEANAVSVAKALVAAEADGLPSHGLSRLPAYADQAKAGKVAGTAGRLEYDPRRGSFRGWLFTAVRNRLRDFLASRQRLCRGSGDTSAQELLEAQPAPPEAHWDRECEWRLVVWAAERVRGQMRDSTWQAFWQTAVEGRPIKEVARALGISAAAVYIARSRVMARLKERFDPARIFRPGAYVGAI